MIRILLAASCLWTASAGVASAQSVPVMVGGEAEWDACGGVGRVVNLDPKGDNFLSMRAGPGGKHREVIRLGPHERYLYMCDERGSWIGIVLGGGAAGRSGCGVMEPIERRQAYRGPCMSGWVHRRYVELYAG
ncbi:integron [Aureimonas sp. ME7]|uniref:integron n=1 Tax=Aureimonas sp. ME7 TaxID=2744252 RepID=UPI0015FA5385|nr:integron [Aureimonas sp. ME7]